MISSFVGSGLWRTARTYQIYGANTNVGKTVVSTILCNAIPSYQPKDKLWFLKPVSTGALDEADDRHISRFARGISTKCLYQFDEPVSPHLAAQLKSCPQDGEILEAISRTLNNWAQQGPGIALVETAGGVLSPGPNGSLQADLYRPLRLPVVLIGDSRLGGVSASISAYESLSIRGYDVEGVILFEDKYYQNHGYLRDFFGKKGVKLYTLPQPPEKEMDESAGAKKKDEEAMATFYERAAKHDSIAELLEELKAKHQQRVERLESMSTKAHDMIWYPFTQHHGMTPKNITVIDSAHDDCFQTLKPEDLPTNGAINGASELLQPTFDGSASWWTQGLGHGNPDLALTSAYAAGRYGHVMFAGNIHEPALALAELLLKEVQNPRLKKVFYTDNGSTGMEVAVKMALRAAASRYGWDASRETVSILGLKGSYHGDTIGVMDCSEPSTYNKRVEWYRGRGYWFDFPKVQLSKGVWSVTIPEEMKKALGPDADFSSLSAIFNLTARKDSELAQRYKEYIKTTLENLVVKEGVKFGALIIEPIILGAGGMLFSDPLFQQCLVQVVRENPQIFSQFSPSPPSSPSTNWSGLPIIFDEVFTGIYRLGRRTSASFLQIDPDIVVNAKLLTGGLLPLCTTMASNEIFQAFDSPHKHDALLHGHSYTANALGCSVAVSSMRSMIGMEESGYWRAHVQDWKGQGVQQAADAKESAAAGDHPTVWSCWSHDMVRDLSFAEEVESIFALGTVLSITLKDREGGGGYTSTAASGLQKQLMAGHNGFTVHSRVLGNVLYLMASVTSKTETLSRIEKLLRRVLL
uniref:Adenosylmethionine-8-amino-7-oxononanoate aminotransferase n=1 Tax=Coccidioides posadasii RMSCC 3488 TaxID=454284 RepID=A0A0J6I1N0_COCPO|nr:adenosylmethionine-8-amino-7-oxononanoate aminotransferase [Coccidioides posadasii RMSCC 3488]